MSKEKPKRKVNQPNLLTVIRRYITFIAVILGIMIIATPVIMVTSLSLSSRPEPIPITDTVPTAYFTQTPQSFVSATQVANGVPIAICGTIPESSVQDNPPYYRTQQWSPDSRYYAYQSGSNLWIYDVAENGIQSIPLENDVANYIAWSQDGYRLLFADQGAYFQNILSVSRDAQVKVYDLETDTTYSLIAGGWAEWAYWEEDGETIIIGSSTIHGDNDVYERHWQSEPVAFADLIPIATGQQHNDYKPEPIPNVSPDGRFHLARQASNTTKTITTREYRGAHGSSIPVEVETNIEYFLQDRSARRDYQLSNFLHEGNLWVDIETSTPETWAGWSPDGRYIVLTATETLFTRAYVPSDGEVIHTPEQASGWRTRTYLVQTDGCNLRLISPAN